MAAIGMTATGGLLVGYSFEKNAEVKEEVMNKVLAEVRTTEILPERKLQSVLKKNAEVTVDHVFRMICFKRWKLATSSLVSEAADGVVFYKLKVEDCLFNLEIPVIFRYSTAHALYMILSQKFPNKTQILDKFPPKRNINILSSYDTFLAQRCQSLMEFFKNIEQDGVLSTSEDVIRFLGLTENRSMVENDDGEDGGENA